VLRHRTATRAQGGASEDMQQAAARDAEEAARSAATEARARARAKALACATAHRATQVGTARFSAAADARRAAVPPQLAREGAAAPPAAPPGGGAEAGRARDAAASAPPQHAATDPDSLSYERDRQAEASRVRPRTLGGARAAELRCVCRSRCMARVWHY
jgi:hypothetical protein